jgi:hypothetical protein
MAKRRLSGAALAARNRKLAKTVMVVPTTAERAAAIAAQGVENARSAIEALARRPTSEKRVRACKPGKAHRASDGRCVKIQIPKLKLSALRTDYRVREIEKRRKAVAKEVAAYGRAARQVERAAKEVKVRAKLSQPKAERRRRSEKWHAPGMIYSAASVNVARLARKAVASARRAAA